MQPGRSSDWEAEGLNTSRWASFIIYVFVRELVQPLKPFVVKHTHTHTKVHARGQNWRLSCLFTFLNCFWRCRSCWLVKKIASYRKQTRVWEKVVWQHKFEPKTLHLKKKKSVFNHNYKLVASIIRPWKKGWRLCCCTPDRCQRTCMSKYIINHLPPKKNVSPKDVLLVTCL